MILTELLQFNNYKKGLKALYKEYDLELGYKLNISSTKFTTWDGKEPTKKQKRLHKKELLKSKQSNDYVISNYKWSLTELWDLDTTIFKFLLPRIYVFYKFDESLAEELEDGTFKQVLEDILEGLLMLAPTTNKAEYIIYDTNKINKCTYLIGKYIRRFWN